MKRIRTVFCGNATVGKTTILNRFATSTFDENSKPTVAGVFHKQFVEKNKEIYDLEIWDTAGDERYGSVILSFFKRAGVVVILFDITNKQTFDNLDYWRNLVTENAPENTPIIIAGNKIDLDETREVTYADAFAYSKSIEAKGFIETSAKSGEGINELFSLISSVNPTEIISNPNISPKNAINIDKKSCC